jgi:hypothetical protein
VYADELRDPSTMPEDVQDNLTQLGITPDYYGELLAADPYAAGAGPNPPLDPDRFDWVQTFPYEPPLHPGDPPSIQTYTGAPIQTSLSTNRSEWSYSVGLTLTGNASFLGIVSSSLTSPSTPRGRA